MKKYHKWQDKEGGYKFSHMERTLLLFFLLCWMQHIYFWKSSKIRSQDFSSHKSLSPRRIALWSWGSQTSSLRGIRWCWTEWRKKGTKTKNSSPQTRKWQLAHTCILMSRCLKCLSIVSCKLHYKLRRQTSCVLVKEHFENEVDKIIKISFRDTDSISNL